MMNISFRSSVFMCCSMRGLIVRCLVVRTQPKPWWKVSLSQREKSTKSKRESYTYVTDDTLAGDVAKYIHENNSSSAYVFEANPGPGVLTKALLKCGVSHLRVFEKDKNFTAMLKDLPCSNPNSLEIIPEDIILLPKLEAKDCHEGTDEAGKLIQGVEKCTWQEAPALSLVAMITDNKTVNFMRFMLPKLSLMNSVFSYGRCQFFVILSEKEHTYMTAQPKKNLAKYRAATVLYNIFFDIKLISEIPGSSLSSNHLAAKKKAKWDASTLYFVHLVPKADLLESVAPVERLPELFYFVRHHMTKRTELVIPILETWFPVFGTKLIYEGMDYYTRFGDLSPSEILRVFQLFSEWPQYESSMFRHVTQQFFDHYLSSEPGHDTDIYKSYNSFRY